MSNAVLKTRLKAVMEEKGWKARSLSEASGHHRNTVYNILNDKNKKINYEVIEAIANTLEISPFYLLGKDEESKNSPAKESGTNNADQEQDDLQLSPHDREIYHQTMGLVKSILSRYGDIKTERVKHFSENVYAHMRKTGKSIEDAIVYAESVIDYALNMEDDNTNE